MESREQVWHALSHVVVHVGKSAYEAWENREHTPTPRPLAHSAAPQAVQDAVRVEVPTSEVLPQFIEMQRDMRIPHLLVAFPCVRCSELVIVTDSPLTCRSCGSQICVTACRTCQVMITFTGTGTLACGYCGSTNSVKQGNENATHRTMLRYLGTAITSLQRLESST